MHHVLGDLCGEQAAVVPERNERLDTGLVQSRRAHQPYRFDAVRRGHHRAPSAQNDGIHRRTLRTFRILRHIVRQSDNIYLMFVRDPQSCVLISGISYNIVLTVIVGTLLWEKKEKEKN